MRLYETRELRLKNLCQVYRSFGILGFEGRNRQGGRLRIERYVFLFHGRLLRRLSPENPRLLLNNLFWSIVNAAIVKVGRTFNQFIERFEGSYDDPSPVSIFTINPSQESLTLSSRNAWISSILVASMFLANANSPLTWTKFSCNNFRRSWKDCCSKDCCLAWELLGVTSPSRYNISNPKRMTFTVTSASWTSFLFRVLNTWNGSNLN